MGTKIADARLNPRTPQQVFEDIKAGKDKKLQTSQTIKKTQEKLEENYKPGFDHGLQEED
jgi:hypothetical protein